MNKRLTVTLCSSLLLACSVVAEEPSISELFDKAKQGDATAQLELAIRYRDAKGVAGAGSRVRCQCVRPPLS